MNRWHINKNGVPALCKAQEGKCPLAKDSKHFSEKEEAQKYADKQMENEYGLLPNKTEEEEKIEKRKKFASVIERVSGTKAAGFKHEIYASLSIAEKMGLERATVFENGEVLVSFSSDEGSENINATLHSEMSTKALVEYYKKVGIDIKDKNKLIRVMYHSDDVDKGILVQSGGPNVLDAAVIKADEVVDIIEMKELSNKAQLPITPLKVDREGFVTKKSLKKQNDYMNEALKNANIKDSDGTDFKVDFGSDEANRRLPLRYLVEKYKEKGATSFIYTTNNGDNVNQISLVGETDEVIDNMIDKDIEANVKLRANLGKRKVKEEDIYRFNNIVSKEYFKSGRSSTTKSFTLQSIKEDKISKSGKYVRIGSYVLPVKYDTYKDNLTKRIKKSDMMSFNLNITGDVKTSY